MILSAGSLRLVGIKGERKPTGCCSVTKSCLTVTPQTAARQASLAFTLSPSLLKLMFTELVMLPNHLTLCRPLLLLPSIFPSIRVFSNESAFRIRRSKYYNM